jgi:hypothetical protein
MTIWRNSAAAEMRIAGNVTASASQKRTCYDRECCPTRRDKKATDSRSADNKTLRTRTPPFLLCHSRPGPTNGKPDRCPPKAEVDSEHWPRARAHQAHRTAALVWPDQCGNSRQRHIVEEWLPGERLPVGLVKLSILQKLADASEVFTKE